jgi:hypothetical protein
MIRNGPKHERRKTWRRVGNQAALTLATVIAVLGLYLVLLGHPDLLFAYDFTQGNITLFSDEPIPAPAAGRVLDDVRHRLGRTSLFHQTATPRRTVYICNRDWRFILFANFRYHVGGLTYAPLNDRIYLRAAHIEANRLVGPSGQEVPAERTLSYFITHEITHTLVAHELGAAHCWQLPGWINEGYADYVAKGADFSYEKATRQLRRGDREMSPELSGLYLRYHLLVAQLLDKNGISVKNLLAGKYNPVQIEDEILADPSPR